MSCRGASDCIASFCSVQRGCSTSSIIMITTGTAVDDCSQRSCSNQSEKRTQNDKLRTGRTSHWIRCTFCALYVSPRKSNASLSEQIVIGRANYALHTERTTSLEDNSIISLGFVCADKLLIRPPTLSKNGGQQKEEEKKKIGSNRFVFVLFTDILLFIF